MLQIYKKLPKRFFFLLFFAFFTFYIVHIVYYSEKLICLATLLIKKVNLYQLVSSIIIVLLPKSMLGNSYRNSDCYSPRSYKLHGYVEKKRTPQVSKKIMLLEGYFMLSTRPAQSEITRVLIGSVDGVHRRFH